MQGRGKAEYGGGSMWAHMYESEKRRNEKSRKYGVNIFRKREMEHYFCEDLIAIRCECCVDNLKAGSDGSRLVFVSRNLRTKNY